MHAQDNTVAMGCHDSWVACMHMSHYDDMTSEIKIKKESLASVCGLCVHYVEQLRASLLGTKSVGLI